MEAEETMERVLEIQQKMSAYLNLRLDLVHKELNGKFKVLDDHVMILDTQVSQTTKAVKQEKLQEGDFKVESYMSFGCSHWCRSTP